MLVRSPPLKPRYDTGISSPSSAEERPPTNTTKSVPFSLLIRSVLSTSTSLPKLNSIFASQLFNWAKRISNLYFLPASTLYGILEINVLQLLNFLTDSPFTNSSKYPVAPHLNTISSLLVASNSVSYLAEKPSSLTPEANSCCPAVVNFIGSTICWVETISPERSFVFQ